MCMGYQNHGLKADIEEARVYIERYEATAERMQGRIQVSRSTLHHTPHTTHHIHSLRTGHVAASVCVHVCTCTCNLCDIHVCGVCF